MKKILLLNMCAISLMAAEFGCDEKTKTAYALIRKDLRNFGFSDEDARNIISALGDFSQYKTEQQAKNAVGEAVEAVRGMLDPVSVHNFFDTGRQFKKMHRMAKLEKRKDVMRRKLDERKATQAAQQVAQVGDNTSSKKSVEQIMAELGLTDYKAGKAKGKKK
jgi:hypothetical protein